MRYLSNPKSQLDNVSISKNNQTYAQGPVNKLNDSPKNKKSSKRKLIITSQIHKNRIDQIEQIIKSF